MKPFYLYIQKNAQILPYIILFVYFGSLARNLADVFTGAASLDPVTTLVMGVVSGVSMVAMVWYTTHISRRAVSHALRDHAEQLPPELTQDEEVANLLAVGGVGIGEEWRSTDTVDDTLTGSPHLSIEMSTLPVNPQGQTPLARSRSAFREQISKGANQTNAHMLEEDTATLVGGSAPRLSDVHIRSAHASPRSQSPRSARGWQSTKGAFGTAVS